LSLSLILATKNFEMLSGCATMIDILCRSSTLHQALLFLRRRSFLPVEGDRVNNVSRKEQNDEINKKDAMYSSK
jgi:phosphosulfolactate phosphohydrolase-like enzyme